MVRSNVEFLSNMKGKNMHLNLKTCFFIFFVLIFAGCSDSDKVLLEKNAAKHLRDPSSTQFRNTYISANDNKVLCGEINGKNAYGAYVGYERFFYLNENLHTETKPPSDRWVKWFEYSHKTYNFVRQNGKLVIEDKNDSKITIPREEFRAALERHGITLEDITNSSDTEFAKYQEDKNWKQQYAQYCEAKKN